MFHVKNSIKMAQFVRIMRTIPITKHFSHHSLQKVMSARFLSGQNQTPNDLPTAQLPKHVEIIERIQSKHGTKYDFALEHIKDVVNYLITECEGDFECVSEMFFQHPTLGDVTKHKWREIVNFLYEEGLPVSDIIDIVTKCPQILRAKISQIESCFEALRQESFVGPNVVHVLQSAPLLLVTDPNHVRRRIALLKTLVTQKDIVHLTTTSPNVLFDDWDDIEAKVQYVVHRIGLDQKQILESCLFVHPLIHVEIRHQIMFRTGFFKKPHPKKRISNPPLTKMIDTTLEEFVAKVGITVEEYEVFEKIYEIESRRRRDVGEESGSSDDDEDEDEDEK